MVKENEQSLSPSPSSCSTCEEPRMNAWREEEVVCSDCPCRPSIPDLLERLERTTEGKRLTSHWRGET